MPFSMVHLCIAYNIVTGTPQIKKPGEFMLGALAPDSVHFRDNYTSDMKKTSHLCVGDEKWGCITNNQEWLENVKAFLQENKHEDKADFIYGYCSHIIADIQNNIRIWMPFRLKNELALRNGAGSVYHQEACAVDYELYLLHPQRISIWQMLENAVGYDIPNVVAAKEIDEMKESVLRNQFSKRESDDLSSSLYVTVPGMQEFIFTESQHIKQILYQ